MMLPPARWPTAVATVFRTFGVRGLCLRAAHELRRRLGAFRRVPRFWVADPYGGGPHPFAVDADALRSATDRQQAVARAERVTAGRYQAFRSRWRALPGDSTDWLRHPDTGRIAEGTLPWWRTRHLDPEFGDIKDLWEPGRFAWAYDLVRGWLVTRDDRYARAFHEHLARWLESSPPFHGPHWSCGQETAIRTAALLYAEANLVEAPSSDPATMTRLAELLAASGERIADAVGYAVSQRNNHGISEAMGLVTLGVRFRDRHPRAGHWLRKGLSLLEKLVREQFAPDGWYIQHSFNYHRLALDQLVVAERALRSVGLGLSRAAWERLAASTELLLAVIDRETGVVPNHGSNDGAFVHPVTLAGYRDFRPVLTAVCSTWGHPLPADVPVDEEVVAWLGPRPPQGPPLEDGVHSGVSGWAVARADGAHVFIRAGRYTSRPGHLDPLHLDVRLDGREVVVDPGTYAYNAPGPWRNGLATAWVHNGPIVDASPPGIRGPRFLWFAWPEAELTRCARTADGAVIVAEIPGRARRTVRVTAGRVRVRDQLLDAEASRLAVLWTLHPDADPAMLRLDAGERRRGRGGEAVHGWFSAHYGERVPTWFEEGTAEREILTEIGPPQETGFDEMEQDEDR